MRRTRAERVVWVCTVVGPQELQGSAGTALPRHGRVDADDSRVAHSASLCPHLFQTDDLACTSPPRMGLPVTLRLGDQQLKEGSDGTTLRHGPGDGDASSGPECSALSCRGTSPGVLGSERRGHPCESERGPSPGMCVFRGGRWPGCLLLWEAGVNWDAERANPVWEHNAWDRICQRNPGGRAGGGVPRTALCAN